MCLGDSSVDINQVRQRLKSFIAQYLRIDEWGIDMPQNISDPRHPPSIALDEPAKLDETGYFDAGLGTPTPVTVTVTFPFQILYRFPSVYRYDQLPRGELEAKVLEVRSLLRQHLLCDLDDVEPETFKSTGSVAIARQENKDWIAVCKLSFSFEMLCDETDLRIPSTLFDRNPLEGNYNQRSGVQVRIPFDYLDPTPKQIHLATGTVFTAQIALLSPFDGDTPTVLNLGDSESPDRLIANARFQPNQAIEYETNPGYTYYTPTQLILSIALGANVSQGSGYILLEF